MLQRGGGMAVIERKKRKIPTYRQIREIQAETAKGLAELQKSITEDRKKAEEDRKKAEEITKSIEELRKSIGRLGNRFGEFAEHTLVPNLTEAFKQFGFHFGQMGENVTLNHKEQNIHTEIDALLENGLQAMAVEVKVHLKTADVEEHRERMGKIRKYADLRGDKRQFFGAIAASIINEDVKKYALKQGFYVIEPSGEDVTITEPFSQPKVW
jgi:hypothetical protein